MIAGVNNGSPNYVVITLPLKVIEVNRRRRRLVLSQREAQKEWDAKRREELIESLEEGQIRNRTRKRAERFWRLC